MTRDDILQRSDCAHCGAEATYTPIQGNCDDIFELECCNIDCWFATPRIVTTSRLEAALAKQIGEQR